ncbi:MAG: helix-turn-helix domain-containing protein [Chloroflexota bacterium]|nr:helix-turn-helix domain-containing protein [Chloroflexota bacterium]
MNPQHIVISFGRVIRARRTQLGYTQETFADRAGLHRTYVGALERGEQNVSLTNLARIATALDVPLSMLFAAVETDLSQQDV